MASRRAFTIIELLVVIVIIAILATVVIISYSNVTQKAIISSLQTDLINASKKIQMDYSGNGSYPNSLASVDGGQGVKASSGNTLTYQFDNTISNPSYCLMASNGSRIYSVSSSSPVSVGGCTTNGVATSGLVLNYDAGSAVSYPTSGTNWYDLSSSASHGVLSNGPTYSATNNGIINFDGVDDYMDFYVPNLSTTTTVEMWSKVNTTYNSRMFFGWQNYDVYTGGNNLGFNTGNGDIYGISSTQYATFNPSTSWNHYIFEMRSDVSYSNNKIYINGVSQTLSQVTLGNGENVGTRNFNSGNGRISMWRGGGAYFMGQSLGVFRVYNRSLSQSEIISNFNAIKARYGL